MTTNTGESRKSSVKDHTDINESGQHLMKSILLLCRADRELRAVAKRLSFAIGQGEMAAHVVSRIGEVQDTLEESQYEFLKAVQTSHREVCFPEEERILAQKLKMPKSLIVRRRIRRRKNEMRPKEGVPKSISEEEREKYIEWLDCYLNPQRYEEKIRSDERMQIERFYLENFGLNQFAFKMAEACGERRLVVRYAAKDKRWTCKVKAFETLLRNAGVQGRHL